MADQERGIYQKDIAMNQDISNKYLDHIILPLRTAGLIKKIAGKRSGYHLARDASEISMLDIYLAYEPYFTVTDCLSDGINCKRNNSCAALSFWSNLNGVMKEYFESVSLASLRDESMNYEHIEQNIEYK